MGQAYRVPNGFSALDNNEKIAKLKEFLAKDKGEKLLKAQGIGIPPDGATHDIAYLVPQNMARSWSAETNSHEDIVLSHLLKKREVFSTEFEYRVVEAYGGGRYQTLFIGANTLPGANKEKIRPASATVRLFADRREIDILGQVVGIIGGINPGGPPQVSRSGLQFITANMLRSLVTEWERMLIHGDEDVDELEFDGLIAQIKKRGVAGLNSHDLRNTHLTFERIIIDVSRISGQPYHARTELIGITEGVWASLQISTADGGLWLQEKGSLAPDAQIPVKGGWTYNPGSQTLVGPNKKRIEFVVVPFLAVPTQFPTEATNTPAQAVTNTVITSSLASDDSDSQFSGDDEGVYLYGFVYVFANGATAGFVTASGVTVEEGDIVTHVMNDAAVGTELNPLRWVDVWRSTPGGDETSLKPLRRHPAKNVSGHTEIVDDNSVIAGTDVALGLMFSEDAIFEAELLKTSRFAIPNVTGLGTTNVAVCKIGTPEVAHHNRQLCWFNVKKADGLL